MKREEARDRALALGIYLHNVLLVSPLDETVRACVQGETKLGAVEDITSKWDAKREGMFVERTATGKPVLMSKLAVRTHEKGFSKTLFVNVGQQGLGFHRRDIFLVPVRHQEFITKAMTDVERIIPDAEALEEKTADESKTRSVRKRNHDGKRGKVRKKPGRPRKKTGGPRKRVGRKAKAAG